MMAPLLLLLGTLVAGAGTLTVDVLSVGQGDAIIVQSPAGKTVLIDAGTGKQDVVPMLRARGIDKIDLAIASHAHADHIGGMDEVLEALPVRVFVDQAMAHTTGTYTKVMGLVESRGVAYKPGDRGVSFNLDDGIRLELLAPAEPKLRGTRSDLNSNSVVVRLTKGDHCMLFTGDAEEPTEQMLLQKGLEPCDVLKVAHHGSGHSSTQRFLDALQPRHAIISCGKDNKYKHPYPETLERLERVGAAVYRTDTQGTIRVMTDGTNLRISALGQEDGGERPMPTGEMQRAEGARGGRRLLAGGGRGRGDGDDPPGPDGLEAAHTDDAAPPVALAVRPSPPRVRPEPPQAPIGGTEPVAAQALATRAHRPSAGGMLDLNAATAGQLDALPGIGPGKAEAIVNWRDRNGPFTSIDQLDDVPGIGPATVAGLRARVEIK